MFVSELGLLSADEVEGASQTVRTLIGKGKGYAEFSYKGDQVVEVSSTNPKAPADINYFTVDLMTGEFEVHPDGFELYPYEGIQVSRTPDISGNHSVSLISGVKRRYHEGKLIEWLGGVTSPAIETSDPLEEQLGLAVDDFSVELGLSAHETNPQQFLALLKEVDSESRLDPFGRTPKQALEEQVVVGAVTLVAAEIVTEAYEAGQIIPSKGGDKLSFRTKAVPIRSERGHPSEPEGIAIQQQRARNTGYQHTIFVVGPLGEEREIYRVHNHTDNRLWRKLPDKKCGNPVSAEIGAGLVRKMERVLPLARS